MQVQKSVIASKDPGFYMDKYSNKTRLVALRNLIVNYWQKHGMIRKNFATCTQVFMNTSSSPCCEMLVTLVW